MTLAFSCGDPAGVGPRVSVLAALDLARDGHGVLLFGDARQLHRLLAAHGARDVDVLTEPAPLASGIAILDQGAVDETAVARHAPDPACGAAQVRALESAANAVRAGVARALVTAPTSKSAVTLSGTPFIGQTEHLARLAGLRDDDVTMLFLGPRLRVGLITTHLALRDVSAAVTVERTVRAATHLGEALVALGRPHGTPLALAGVNPHAGEAGLFGDEEERVFRPALELLRTREPFASGRVRLAGVVPAETAFRRAADASLDGVIAAFHDQATIASKLLDWGAAANVTWGLPFLRTSVDHGVAYDAAARGEGDAEGMIAAARIALALTERR